MRDTKRSNSLIAGTFNAPTPAGTAGNKGGVRDPPPQQHPCHPPPGRCQQNQHRDPGNSPHLVYPMTRDELPTSESSAANV
jgi:hypothetical protein